MATDALEVDGVRPDIIISKTAITLAAFFGRNEVELDDLQLAAQLTLSHRTRRGGLLEPPSPNEIDQSITKALEVAQKQDKRKSPQETGKESNEKSGPRQSGGKFGRQGKMAEMSMGEEGKKKRRLR
jgi:magnesium chelatase subunit D